MLVNITCSCDPFRFEALKEELRSFHRKWNNYPSLIKKAHSQFTEVVNTIVDTFSTENEMR